MEHDQRPFAICLMGPTASGKTAIAIALHEMFPVEIVSVDSSQVYRGMDIGTAKPSAAEQARAPHRLIDIRDPTEIYSAAQFRDDALREMGDIVASGKIPLLVGGTMFYFRALEYGLSHLPPAAPDVRQRIGEQARREGWPTLHARLARIDPRSARRIDANDAQRIQRALEIHAVTGKPPSALTRVATPAPYRFHKIGLWPEERAGLHARIAERFAQMLERGLIDEVEALYRRGDIDASAPSLRTVGYRQIWAYLTKRINYIEMIDRSVAATRQLAKRQITWLRRYPDLQRADGSGETPLDEVATLVRRVTIDIEARR
ncbi:MAG TPA: tRNA (adenosine(37)-N6)-dimethylallyltransferase MiaA [Burkholderiales bacterium]